jgi:hypothetical protein
MIRAIVARHDPNTPVRRDRTLKFLSVSKSLAMIDIARLPLERRER